MTKPNKLFSWLGFGKKPEADPTPTTAPTTEVISPSAEEVVPAVESETKDQMPQVLFSEPAVEHAIAAEMPSVSDRAEAVTSPQNEHHLSATAAMVPTEAVVAATAAEPVMPAPSVSPLMPEAAAGTFQSIAESAPEQSPAVSEKKPGFFARLKQGLSKTSQNLGNGLASLFLGKKIDDDLYEELETQLLMADVGVDTSQKLIKQLVQHADRRQLKDADSLYEKLQQEMAGLLDDVEKPLDIRNPDGPFVILMVGVNGVGKTTTIGKMAQQFKQQGKSVMLAAGDTFRAAAVEQLQVWGDRNQIPVIAQHSGADSASVIFDAYQAAKARKIDVLIADTAGRLQNKAHLMEELKKIVRVMKKIDGAAPHEVMLTLDAGTGQNALSQAKLFHEAVELTGISLTKLDGTAKGGVIFAIADQFKLPIRYIGVGESIDDLRVFNSKDFIRALFNKEF